MKKIIYIAGLARSGTTFLQLCLCQKYNVVGLGEIHQTIQGMQATDGQIDKKNWLDIKGRVCSCGLKPERCDFWSEIYCQAKDNSLSGLHEMVIKKANEIFSGIPIIDSSKDIKGIDLYRAGKEEYDLKVIFIVRDVRAWERSIKKHAIKNGQKYYGQIIEYYRWMMANMNIESHLEKNNIKFLMVQNENLLFNSEAEWRRIDDFIDAEKSIGKLTMHDIYGSRFKNNENKSIDLKYDINWHQNNLDILSYFLSFPVLRKNSGFYNR